MDKSTILNQITEKAIFLAFLGLSEFPKGNISSPFSEDKKPSFKLYANNTFKCHSTGRQGDVWQFVADLNGIDCKTEFYRVLAIVTERMGLNDPTKHFRYTEKPMSEDHLSYWRQGNWNVCNRTLEKYQVSALDRYECWNAQKNEIDKRRIFPNVIAFVYKTETGAEIYVPKQEKAKKFIMNKTIAQDIFGLRQLPKQTESIIISAGKKDCLILNANGFPSVCFRSENHNPTESQISHLKGLCEHLFICYDNDPTGQKSMLKTAQKHEITPISLPQEYNDIADFFKENRKESFKHLIEQTEKKENQENVTIFHITENYLGKHYKFRYNTISLDIEINKNGTDEWNSLNEDTVYVELQKRGIKISMNNLISLIKSYVPHYNPIKEYFQNLPTWNGKTDHIQNLAGYVQALDKTQFAYHFKKWMVRTVKCALLGGYFNKQAFVLVHSGQNSGKSTFCRFLCPPSLSQFIAEDISNDKDARVLLCKNFLINLDELAVLSKREINSLKSFFSKTQVNERLPYDRKNTILPRVASFIGSTNQDSFLNDETGSVRWLCFNINSIDWDYKKNIDINAVWAQAYALSTDNAFNSEMTIEDIRINEERNKGFQIVSTEQEVISRYILRSDRFKGEFVTASDLMIYFAPLGIKLNSMLIGKALTSLGFEKVKNNRTKAYGYYVTKKELIF